MITVTNPSQASPDVVVHHGAVHRCPPRRDSLGLEQSWAFAQEWVEQNMVEILRAASPYRAHMSADEGDLRQEAILAVLAALRHARHKGSLDRFRRHFFGCWKRTCIQMAQGVPTNKDMDVSQVADPASLDVPSKPHTAVVAALTRLDLETVARKLGRLTARQKSLCQALLGLGPDATTWSLESYALAHGRSEHSVRILYNRALARLASPTT